MKRFILSLISTAASTTLNAQGLKIELKYYGFAAVPGSTEFALANWYLSGKDIRLLWVNKKPR